MPLPPIKEGMDSRVAIAQHRAGLVKANRNLDATRDCQKEQREHFARGG